MVFLTRLLNIRHAKRHTDQFLGNLMRSTDSSWRKRRVLMMSSHFFGRKRNCFRIASRYVQKALVKATAVRSLFRADFRDLCETRIQAASAENGYNSYYMREALARTHIHLNTKVLANMAIWEPRTFRAIAAISAFKENQDREVGGLGANHRGPGIQIVDDGKL